jgi:carbon storage regulator
MLVLSRKLGEEIVIGDNIRLTVVAILGNQVRLGFTAPRDVFIQREELRPEVEDLGTACAPGNPGGEALTDDANASPPLPDVEQLEARVLARLGGRVRNFRLLVRGGGLVLTGQARTYYAKQLAQHEVREAAALPIVANEIDVC